MFSTLPPVLRRAGLRQAARVLHYGLIVLAAWAAAVVVVKLVGLDLHPKVSAKPASEAETAKVTRSNRAADDAVILKRNLFGATDLEVSDEEGPAVGGDDLKLKGVATTPKSSWAVFENTSSGEQNVFALGDKVFDGPKLVAVDTTGAEVLLRGKKRRYELEEEESAAAAEPKRGRGEGKKTGKPTDKKGKAAADPASGVKKTGENAYLVDRREIENAVSNLNEVITQARAVPVMADGKSSGFKLFSIRPGSIFQKVGLEDGDVVQRINDTVLTDPSKAVGLLEEIQSMAQIRINFVRGGKLRTYTYTIR